MSHEILVKDVEERYCMVMFGDDWMNVICRYLIFIDYDFENI